MTLKRIGGKIILINSKKNKNYSTTRNAPTSLSGVFWLWPIQTMEKKTPWQQLNQNDCSLTQGKRMTNWDNSLADLWAFLNYLLNSWSQHFGQDPLPFPERYKPQTSFQRFVFSLISTHHKILTAWVCRFQGTVPNNALVRSGLRQFTSRLRLPWINF